MPSDPTPEWVLAHRRAIGDRIREVRTAAKLSQQRLAELAGMERQAVNKIELGHQAAYIDSLIRLAAALKVPLADLMR